MLIRSFWFVFDDIGKYCYYYYYYCYYYLKMIVHLRINHRYFSISNWHEDDVDDWVERLQLVPLCYGWIRDVYVWTDTEHWILWKQFGSSPFILDTWCDVWWWWWSLRWIGKTIVLGHDGGGNREETINSNRICWVYFSRRAGGLALYSILVPTRRRRLHGDDKICDSRLETRIGKMV